MAARSALSARRPGAEPPASSAGDRPDAGCACSAEATALLASSAANRFGKTSPSIYETSRLVGLAPWLTGHRARVDHLLATQHRDGGWGGPDGYALVPTLGAVEALLGTVLDPPRRAAEVVPVATTAVDAGLAFAHERLRALRAADLPDTPAIEVLVPFLVARLHARLDELRRTDTPGLHRWRGRVRLALPKGLTDGVLRAVTGALASGAPAPLKVLHSLEIAAELATGIRGVPRLSLGTVGASPAATAAWLGEPARDRSGAVLRYLRAVAAQHGGPVPSVVPITNFERSWVVNSLAAGGVPVVAPPRLVAAMRSAVGAAGVPGGIGLPPDGDTTSGTLTALRHLGVPVRDTVRRKGTSEERTGPNLTYAVLRRYDVGTHFCTWADERTASPTTNAHVITALAAAGGRGVRRASAVDRTATWLREVQHRDGFWSDKWHASPFYATACAVLALRDAEPGTADPAVDRAVAWVLDSQRRDGGWGRWAGTAEETAYALQILLYRASPDRRVRSAAGRGHRFLLSVQDTDPPPLWHDKDLYTPAHVVRAAVIGARHLAETVLRARF